MDDIISKIFFFIWGSFWGKIAILVFVVFATITDILEWLGYRRAKRAFRPLAEQWPPFSWHAIECRVRTVAEKYFHGWNNKDFSGLEEHMTKPAFEKINGELEEALQSGQWKLRKIVGVTDPKLLQTLTPNHERPATVEVEVKTSSPHLFSGLGWGESTYLFVLGYDQKGKWTVGSIRRDDEYKALLEAKGEVNTSWLEKNELPEPHSETTSPKRPDYLSKRIAGTGKVQFQLARRFSFLSLIALVVGVMVTIFWHNRIQEEELLETGTPIEADVQDVFFSKTLFIPIEDVGEFQVPSAEVSYRFTPPKGEKPFYEYLNELSIPTTAEVTEEVAREAEKTRKISVLYDPESPERNVPADVVIPSIWNNILLLAIGVFLPGIFALKSLVSFVRMLIPRFSFFWQGWKPTKIKP